MKLAAAKVDLHCSRSLRHQDFSAAPKFSTRIPAPAIDPFYTDFGVFMFMVVWGPTLVQPGHSKLPSGEPSSISVKENDVTDCLGSVLYLSMNS